jgi:hypothetical protein
MPFEGGRARTLIVPARSDTKRRAVEGVVYAAVLEVLSQPWADLEPQLGRDGDVSGIVETMYVRPQRQAILHVIRCRLASPFGRHPFEAQGDVQRLRPGGGTNVTAGLRKSLELLQAEAKRTPCG